MKWTCTPPRCVQTPHGKEVKDNPAERIKPVAVAANLALKWLDRNEQNRFSTGGKGPVGTGGQKIRAAGPVRTTREDGAASPVLR